ncbi:sialate O-acetylesterase [Stieleria varia]|uniref:F5/8 type C domain protein n=1 Tax=Stieleria varia TaxID=2528005 RepID=A0A5C5ZKS6_9BACT|nr:sialate O-acetylesterase [Stieleria varia]TWT87755.1 F5/8 type C domain protein [Stieleria varia]
MKTNVAVVWLPLLAGLFCMGGSATRADELSLAHVFSDSMVLQRDRELPVWGRASQGDEITVRFGDQQKTVTTGSDGRWMVMLDPMDAESNPQELQVSAAGSKQAIKRTDVLVGEVWLASGQSNMEWEMRSKADSQADIPKADFPQLRLLEVTKAHAMQPMDTFTGTWSAATPDSVASFSAVGYYFGLKLHQELGVPVGIIQSAWGGTRIEPWTDRQGFTEVEALQDLAQKVNNESPGTAEYQHAHTQHMQSVASWASNASKAISEGTAVPPLPPQPPTMRSGSGTPTSLYNAMIHPLVPYAIRGAIWYQGESNHAEGLLYTEKTKALLASWRRVFRDPELPFYFVQIAPYQYGDEDTEILPRFWEAQEACLEIPHTGMAVITDIGEVGDIHPAKKMEVARRLSLWALAKQYGKSDIDPSGPRYESHRIDGDTVHVTFSHAEAGLKSRDGKPLTHFQLAGVDGKFHDASATIDGKTVVLRSDAVAKPRQVRFGWNKTAMPNLIETDGLPASAFHTHWPDNADLGKNVARGCKWQSSDSNTYGWNTGLTDGNIGNNTPQCFATGADARFPKTVTIDLEKSVPINAVVVCQPAIGSTKTIEVSVSTDGKNYAPVGRHAFDFGKEQRKSFLFEDQEAQFVRLTYIDHHDKKSGDFSQNFAFTSEVEVYHANLDTQ